MTYVFTLMKRNAILQIVFDPLYLPEDLNPELSNLLKGLLCKGLNWAVTFVKSLGEQRANFPVIWNSERLTLSCSGICFWNQPFSMLPGCQCRHYLDCPTVAERLIWMLGYRSKTADLSGGSGKSSMGGHGLPAGATAVIEW